MSVTVVGLGYVGLSISIYCPSNSRSMRRY